MSDPRAAVWTFDPARSRLGFSIKHLLVSRTRGEFKSWSGTVQVAPNRTASVEVLIDAGSLDTGDALRDAALQGKDLLHSSAFPKLKFVAGCPAIKGSKLDLSGSLTIKTTTRPLRFQVDALDRLDDLDRASSLRFRASTKLEWKSFGLAWTGLLAPGGMLVGDVLDVEIEATLRRQDLG